ncbi:MAG: Asp-tRNA(Asn)/Glu-tRNA(Gln) amidotransferase subunit GatC [Candidatus Paceibacterota bacterium]
MITEKDIHALADLARLKLTLEEEHKLTQDIDAILGYVGTIASVSVPDASSVDEYQPHNVLREDTDAYKADTFTEALLNEVAERQERSVVVKKILS